MTSLPSTSIAYETNLMSSSRTFGASNNGSRDESDAQDSSDETNLDLGMEGHPPHDQTQRNDDESAKLLQLTAKTASNSIKH